MSDILNKLNSNAHPECTYVGKNYTKADLIKDVERLEADKVRLEGELGIARKDEIDALGRIDQLAQDKERLEARVKELEKITRNWAEDISLENGNYLCTCIECGEGFIGHKRRVVCRVCHSINAEQALGEKGNDT